MALDNAQFISELSITDPPGTDPVSEGDDQIRTTKRATQQSFPNINAAVTLTSAQLNQAAIKNEANTFTQINTFQANTTFGGRLRAIDGSAGNPTYSFTADNSSGMYSGGLSSLRLAVAGAEQLRLVPASIRAANLGLEAAPVWTFTAANTSGMFAAAGSLNFSVNAVERLRLSTAAVTAFLQVRGVDGTVGAPSFSFSGDSTTGMFRQGAILSFAVSGGSRFDLSTTVASFNAVLQAQNGSAGAPTFSFFTNTNTGMYRAANNVLNLSTAGVDRLAITGSEFNIKSTQVWAAPGSALAPAYSFASNPTMGMFNSGANFLSFATAGQARASLSPASELNIFQNGATGGVTINFMNSAGIVAWAIQYEGTAGFQPQQFSFSRFNATTGAFIDIPFYIATNGRVHSLLPILTP